MKITGTINSCAAIFFCARATPYSSNFTAIQTIQRDACCRNWPHELRRLHARAQRVSWVKIPFTVLHTRCELKSD
jgi:hypothetical protein